MAALGPIMFIAAALLWGLSSDDAGFFGTAAVIALVGAFVVRFPGLWAKVVGMFLAILVSGALFWTAFGLFAPGSFFDFVPGLLVLPGTITCIVACIAALRSRNQAPGDATSDRPRKVIRSFVAVVGVLAIVSAGLTFASKKSVDSTGVAATVTLSDFEYDKDEYDFAAGSKVLVRNDDPFIHTFTIEELNVDEVLSPGSEILVTIPSEPGEYILFCDPHTDDSKNPTEDDMAARARIE
jgi:plastocyanin